MSLLCYFWANKVIMKIKIHDPFINLYSPRTIYICSSKLKNTTYRYDVISQVSVWWFRHLTRFSTSTLNLESIGGKYSSLDPILRKLWQFKKFKNLYFFFQMSHFQKMSGTVRVKKEQKYLFLFKNRLKWDSYAIFGLRRLLSWK